MIKIEKQIANYLYVTAVQYTENCNYHISFEDVAITFEMEIGEVADIKDKVIEELKLIPGVVNDNNGVWIGDDGDNNPYFDILLWGDFCGVEVD